MTKERAGTFPTIEKVLEDPGIRALFSKRFLVAAEIYDDLVDAACWEILGKIAEERTGKEGFLAFPEHTRPAIQYIFEKLRHRGYLLRGEEGEGGASHSAGAVPVGETPIHLLRKSAATLAGTPAAEVAANPRLIHLLRKYSLSPAGPSPASVGSLTAELVSTVPEAAIGAEIVQVLVDEAPAFFDGSRTGEEILFAPNRLPLWIRYFSNDNILYAINNTLGAEILSRVLPPHAEVLEVGGGCGSAAEAALRKLGPRIARYRFTELVPTFARRGERAARAAASTETTVESAKLDMTKPWAAQGVAPGTFDAVYSVNCFHVAPDLDAVLAEAKAALKPGGIVVVSECIRPSARTGPSYVELIFNFLESFTSVKTDPVTRPAHGFLTPEAWRRSFEAAGLPEVAVFPDVDAVARTFPDFVGVVAAREP